MNSKKSSNQNKDNTLRLRSSETAELTTRNSEIFCESMQFIKRSDTSIMVRLPGLHYNDFNRLGKPCVWSIVKYTEHARPAGMMASSAQNLFGLERVLSKPLVVSHQLFRFTRALHKHVKLGQAFLYTCSLGFMAEKTYSYHEEIRDEKTNELLAENDRMLMFMDPKTRRPCAIPADVKAKYSLHATTKRMRVATPPANDNCPVYTWTTTVAHSDTDMLYHINQAVYSRYCMDCAMEATSIGFYNKLHGDFLMYDPASMHCSYLQELFPEDKIAVKT